MTHPKILYALALSLIIVISTAAIANVIGHQLFPVEKTNNSRL